jgi:hypothetical protein
MRGWSFYLADVGLRLSVWVVFAIIRFGLFPSIGFRWFDFAWIVVAFWVGQVLSIHILYFRRRDLLRAILEQATPTPNQTMHRTPTRRSPHISND